MELVITPTFAEIFPRDERPTVENLVSDIPKTLLIRFVARMNAMLYQGQTNLETQKILLKDILKRNPETLQNAVNVAIELSRQEGGRRVQFFTTHANLELMHQILIFGNDNSSKFNTTPLDELNTFKAYTIITDELSKKADLEDNGEALQERFQRITWTMMSDQILLNKPIQYFTSVVKGKCLFDSLIESDYKSYIDNFLKLQGDPNSLTYLLRLVELIQGSYEVDRKNGEVAKYNIIPTNNTKQFLDNLTIDLDAYKHTYISGHKGYLGIKDKPLMLVENKYCVLDWNLFAGKIYYGLIYDLYRGAGLINQMKFVDFKSFVGNNSIERYLFRRLINSAFKGRHAVIVYDDKSANKVPDAYVRLGNKVFLFEIKDTAFSADVLASNDYSRIKNEVNKKYNAEKKGTGQLERYCSSLMDKPYEKGAPQSKTYKNKNLTIYPVIIYTDPVFELPGMMRYLQSEFEKKIVDKKMSFKAITPLLFINLDFFIENIHFLKERANRLDKVFDHVLSELKKRKLRFDRTKSRDAHFELNEPFEVIAQKFFNGHKNNQDYLQTLFEELDIKKNLD